MHGRRFGVLLERRAALGAARAAEQRGAGVARWLPDNAATVALGSAGQRGSDGLQAESSPCSNAARRVRQGAGNAALYLKRAGERER